MASQQSIASNHYYNTQTTLSSLATSYPQDPRAPTEAGEEGEVGVEGWVAGFLEERVDGVM
jgi:hypothetical protein